MKYLCCHRRRHGGQPRRGPRRQTPLEYADIPTIDSLAARGTVGSVVNCPKPLPAGSETAILSIFGCDPLKHFSGRSPMEAAAIGLRLVPGDAAFRCNLVALEPGDQPYEEKRILSHSAGSIAGQDALDVVAALNSDPEFSAALRAADMHIDPSPSFRPLAVKHHCDPSGVRFSRRTTTSARSSARCSRAGRGAARQGLLPTLCALPTACWSTIPSPRSAARRASSARTASVLSAGTAMQLPDFREEYGCGRRGHQRGALCHGIGVSAADLRWSRSRARDRRDRHQL